MEIENPSLKGKEAEEPQTTPEDLRVEPVQDKQEAVSLELDEYSYGENL